MLEFCLYGHHNGNVLTNNLTCFFAEMRFLHSLIMSGIQFQILMPSFLNVDLRLSEPCLTKILHLILFLCIVTNGRRDYRMTPEWTTISRPL